MIWVNNFLFTIYKLLDIFPCYIGSTKIKAFNQRYITIENLGLKNSYEISFLFNNAKKVSY